MSRGGVEVLAESDLTVLGYGIYNGTADQYFLFIEPTSGEAWNRYRSNYLGEDDRDALYALFPACQCGGPRTAVLLVNDYGKTTWNPATACLTCKVIVDVDEDEVWDGRPEAGLAPSRSGHPHPDAQIFALGEATTIEQRVLISLADKEAFIRKLHRIIDPASGSPESR